jgi:hypothetical protein
MSCRLGARTATLTIKQEDISGSFNWLEPVVRQRRLVSSRRVVSRRTAIRKGYPLS